MSDQSPSNNLKWFTTIARYLILFSIIGVIAYKLIITPIQLNIDFLALLSLTLALFSVGLSALFYFKTTETSNAFYDNTLKYTKDIAEFLVRIESGFGERLKHLDEGYTRMQDKVMPTIPNEDVGKLQEKLQKREQELNQNVQDRDKLINELVTSSKLEGKRKEEFLSELAKRNTEFVNARKQIETLSNEIQALKQFEVIFDPERLKRKVSKYILGVVLHKLNLPANTVFPSRIIALRWTKNLEALNKDFIHDMKRLEFVNDEGNLTEDGILFISETIKNNIEEDIPF